jgi:hypothetical protein
MAIPAWTPTALFSAGQHPSLLLVPFQPHPALSALLVSQFVFWVVGTIVGGALGFLAMWHPALALSPFGLVAVVVAAALVVGLLGVTKARVAITLLLMTLSTLILVSAAAD